MGKLFNKHKANIGSNNGKKLENGQKINISKINLNQIKKNLII